MLRNDSDGSQNLLPVGPVHLIVNIGDPFLLERKEVHRYRQNVHPYQLFNHTQVECWITCVVRSSNDHQAFFVFWGIGQDLLSEILNFFLKW
ncbi:hypothetical protein ES705_50970 [subsurface metagenome]